MKRKKKIDFFGQDQVPNLQEHEGDTAAWDLHDPDFTEELSVLGSIAFPLRKHISV